MSNQNPSNQLNKDGMILSNFSVGEQGDLFTTATQMKIPYELIKYESLTGRNPDTGEELDAE
jgi:hypothetical protein